MASRADDGSRVRAGDADRSRRLAVARELDARRLWLRRERGGDTERDGERLRDVTERRRSVDLERVRVLTGDARRLRVESGAALLLVAAMAVDRLLLAARAAELPRGGSRDDCPWRLWRLLLAAESTDRERPRAAAAGVDAVVAAPLASGVDWR